MKSHAPSSGFSLVISLVILTLLSILVMSFLATSTLDRVTSSAFSSKTKAELAADTAVNQAIGLLSDTITQYPDSATVWEPLLPTSGTVPATEGTVLYYSDTAPNAANPQIHLLPLFSQGVDASGQLTGPVPLASKASTLSGDGWDDNNSINLNRQRFNGDKAGWIGTPPPPPGGTASATPKPFRARWNEIKEAVPAPGFTTPRVVARYAFWVEDESFKVNLNYMGSMARGSDDAEAARDTQRMATNPSDGMRVANHTPIQGLLRSANATIDYDTVAGNAVTLRDGFFGKRLFELPAFNQVSTSYNLGDETKFLATIFSGGLNVSRHGSQRLNLNGLGFDQTNQPPADAFTSTQRIVETIRYHAPKFHQRFYRNTPQAANPSATYLNTEQVAAAHQNPYLYKVAANIRDFIDPDVQPTMITDAGAAAPAVAPTSAFGDDGEIMWAQGKEGIYLQEAAVRERIDTKANKLRYNLKVDYYLEFWNMTGKDIYATSTGAPAGALILGSNPFASVANQQRWLAQKDGSQLKSDNSPSGDPIQGPARDMVIDIGNGVYYQGAAAPSGVVFKAGQATVITTDPDYAGVVQVGGGVSPNFSGGMNAANTYYCSVLKHGKREYAGPIPGPWTSGTGGIHPDFRDGKEDYDTEVILGNDKGYIDSLPCAIAMGSTSGPIVTDNEIDEHWYGGTLLGNNTTASELGDPRTNNEQLTYTRFLSGASTGEPDQSRYFNQRDPPRFSLGYPNDLYLNPQTNFPWPDYYKGWAKLVSSTGKAVNPTAATAPQTIANAKLTSVGQLGDIFDPARVAGGVGSLGVTGARGGGRTFKIGQKDDRVDMSTLNAASRQWASWRLVDMFSVTNELEVPGLININGLRRDNGAALRAACYGMTLKVVSAPISPGSAVGAVTTPALNSVEANPATAPAGLQRLINQAVTRLSQTDATKPAYFRERGEISELDAYTSANADLVGGSKSSEWFDHSREELGRRLVEMITTRGNIFSVYAVGQSIQESNDPARTKHVTGEHAVKVTFALLPRKADGTAFRVTQETFVPTSTPAIQDRFAKPDHYDVLFLQVTPL